MPVPIVLAVVGVTALTAGEERTPLPATASETGGEAAVDAQSHPER